MQNIFMKRRYFLRGTTVLAVSTISTLFKVEAADQPVLKLSTTEIDVGLDAGHELGTLSVSGSSRSDWAFRLLDDAGGSFALAGNRLVVGSAGLDRGSRPHPQIIVQAAADDATVRQSFAMTVRQRLPKMPLPVGARIAVHGDSQQAFNNGQVNAMSSEKKLAADNFGYGTMTQVLSVDPRFNFDSWYDAKDPYGRFVQGANQGIFGDHMVWDRPEMGNGIIPRLEYTLSKKPDIILFSGGTNSLSSGDTVGRDKSVNADYIIAKLDEGLRRIRNEGIPVILQTLMPRGGGDKDWASGDPRIHQLELVNDWIREQYETGRTGIVGLFDPWDVLAVNGLPRPEYMDMPRVHPNLRGAYIAAITSSKSLLSAIRANVEPGSVFDQHPAVDNMLGASMGQMAGKSGRKISTGTTGDIASGFSLRMTRGTSVQQASKKRDDGDIERQVITITPTADGTPYHWSDFSLADAAISTLPSEGQWYRGYLHVEIGDTTEVGAINLTVSLINGDSAVLTAAAMQVNSGSFAQPSVGNRSYWMQTEPFLAPVSAQGVQMTARIAFPSTASAPFTVIFSRPIIRHVEDPRPAWGYATAG